MLFQNSWDVPLGITAIVNFFVFFDPDRLQLTAAIAPTIASKKIIFRILFSFVLID